MKKVATVLFYLTLVYFAFFWPTLKSNTVLEFGNDARRFGYPVRVYLWEKLHDGKFPFWTERMLSGYPIYADIETGYLNPINLALVYLFGPYTSYKLLHFLSYLLGSIGFILFLKLRLKSRVGILVAHFVYFFSFFSLYHQQHFVITFAYYLFPCFLYLLERYIQNQKTRYLFLYLLLLLNLLYFGSFQMSFIVIVASITYILSFKALTKDFISRSVFPCLVFLCLLMPLIVSYLGLYTASERFSTHSLWLEGSFSPQVALNLLYPFNYRFGDSYMGVILNRDFLMHEVYIYLGVSGLILAILGVVFSKLDRQTNRLLLLFIATFLILGFAKSNPLLSTVDPPFFSLFRYWGRLVFLLIFSLSVYCGHFVDQLSQLSWKSTVRKVNLRFLSVSMVYLAILELIKFPNFNVFSLFRLWMRQDYKFDYIYVYLGFFLTFIVFLCLTLLLKKSTYIKYALFAMPVLELAVFGNLVLRDAFINVDQTKANLSSIESTYANQRIIVTDADVIGNKTLYYKFWSPFGYVSSLNKYYDGRIKSLGFESVRRPVLTSLVKDGFNDTNLQYGLKNIGVNTITDSKSKIYYRNTTNSMFYLDSFGIPAYLEELERSEEQHKLKIYAIGDVKINSYLRYDSGWKVVLNNQPIKVNKDELFLSFNLPAGTNMAEVKYLPHTFYISLVVTVIGIVFFLALRRLVETRPTLKFYILVALIFLVLRLPGLGSDVLNSDGARWHRRSERFLQAIKTGDFASTYQHYQPGVTLMWINSVTKKAVWETQDLFKIPRWTLENSQDFPKIHAVSKSVLVIILSILLIYQMFIITKISSLKVALIYGFFVSTEPYLIGIDRWFHLTSLESYFAFSAYLTYFYSLARRSRLSVLATGALVALSTLSKLTGIIVLPLITVTEIIRGYYAKNIKRSLISLGIIVASFSLVVFVLFPALWVDFLNVVQKLFGAVVSAMDNDTRAQYFKPPFSYIYYLVILAYKLSPITLFIFLASLVVFVRQLERKEPVQGRFVLAYFLTFFLVLTMSTKKIDRYALALIQPILLFASIYLAKLKHKTFVFVIAIQLIASTFIYFRHFPVLSSYYSPIFGGAKTALNMGVYENSGEYFAQAAFYLNNTGRADVYAPDNYESFKYFYHGNTLRDFAPSAKYVITSIDFDRKTPRNIKGCETLKKEFGPKSFIPLVYIYACKN
ncbi:MAG: hypothetical protein WC988_00540 [Patescibacteria group bacterium]